MNEKSMRNKQAELIKSMTDEELYKQLLLTQGLLLITAAVIGFLTFDGIEQFSSQLQINTMSLLLGFMAGLVVVGLDLAGMKYFPPAYYDDGGINERIFQSLSIPRIFFLTALIAIGEEVLFRGVIQANWGIWVASGIFAVIHIRYLSHWYLFLNICLLSLFIGYIFEITGSLWATILMHFIIDLLLGLFLNKKGKDRSS
ncbi:CPBP family intramembrane glutamic endopeptidase [Pradoshia eiseniae]|nr:CPBP family intramembrane glutamic endopeptidase [Pradoshia eiseniae]